MACEKSTCESDEPKAPLRVCDKPIRKSAQAVARLCKRLARKDSADELQLAAVDEYDETQESDTALTTTTNTDTIPKRVTDTTNMPTGKLTKKCKANAKRRAVEVRSDSGDNDSDDDSNSESPEELEGKYIHTLTQIVIQLTGD